MQFRYRRELLVVALGLFALAFTIALYIVAPSSPSWNLIYLNIPLFLLCFMCIFGSLVACRFLPRKWGVCFLGGTTLGLTPLLLTLFNLLVLVVSGEKSALVILIFDRYAEWLYEPGAVILSVMGLQFDIYSSHISESWLLISWTVYTLLAMLIWTMVLAVALRAFYFRVFRQIRGYKSRLLTLLLLGTLPGKRPDSKRTACGPTTSLGSRRPS